MDAGFKLAPEQWATLRRLLDEALDLPAAERDGWLAHLPPQHAAYGPRLKSLLAHVLDGGAARLMQTLPKFETDHFAPRPPGAKADAPGDFIGPYRLLRELGSGGMASVWLAERIDMLQSRQVALKLPHGAWKRAGLAERLQREREILATLNHPNIATLYDAGVADDGQPYLALEHVEGERIDAYCRRLDLDAASRLRLFMQVARAVAHAHAQLVVHRDLKPSNILVTNAGDVKLLDFGIAKLLDQGEARETELTQAVGRVLTPDYAAPEQILGRPVGTAADQYALGVLLFELLADTRPYRLARGSRAELEEAILRADPPRPSAVAPPARRAALRGDLDTIVLKALQRDPAVRYATVDAFAADIERHLAGLPVLARPDGAGYRLHKFITRHRTAAAMAATLVLALVAGAGAALWQAQAARAEQHRAQQALEFVTSIFRDADPWQSGQRRPDVLQLLNAARAPLATELRDAPLVRAELLAALAEALVGLQDEDAAAEAAAAAVELATAAAGADHPLVLRARLALVEAHFLRDRLADTRVQLEQVLRMIEARPQRHAVARVPALALLARLEIDEGRFAQGERTAQAALAAAAESPGQWIVREIELWREIAVSHHARGQVGPAVAAAKRALDLAEAHYRRVPNHPDLIDTRARYGRVLAENDRRAEGIALLRASLAAVAENFGADSRAMALQQQRLGSALWLDGQLDEARTTLSRALELLRRHNPPESPAIGAMLGALAKIELRARRPAEALAWAEEALTLAEQHRGNDLTTLDTLRGLRALARMQIGAVDDGLDELRRLAAAASGQGPEAEAAAWHRLGVGLRLAGQPAAAVAAQQQAAALGAQQQAVARRSPLSERLHDRAEVAAELGLLQAPADIPPAK